MSDSATLAYYERAAPRYTASSAQDRHQLLDPFLDRLTPGAEILELGCGIGLDSAHILKRGFILDATDGAAAMVRKANERFDIGARQMRFDELDTVERYDAIWAHACLHHLPRADLSLVIERIFRALRAGGLHFANYKLGDKEHPDEGRDITGRWSSLPSSDWLDALYGEAGFMIEHRYSYNAASTDGTRRDWYALTVSKGAQ